MLYYKSNKRHISVVYWRNKPLVMLEEHSKRLKITSRAFSRVLPTSCVVYFATEICHLLLKSQGKNVSYLLCKVYTYFNRCCSALLTRKGAWVDITKVMKLHEYLSINSNSACIDPYTLKDFTC